ncbi:PAS domain S-box-containing protein/diguanylate cyclase (GGDEF)-like protein [Pseudoduganella lurida]|uniref:PAS domain S-box-containing protein/diguanylate cyclase (GGDEF)-like protein n=1 Tax=Pseudoduganella lurida TaxID=1036180 RepID=A0A562RLD9_9BURK|nr:EAL domain-containing protein [Pseudoduganella lurida]TWI69855.1 PAS domain S-box-containing protein/diguanylate cyclase (GGDEF)-like protein [Pseudoduganella lurida]
MHITITSNPAFINVTWSSDKAGICALPAEHAPGLLQPLTGVTLDEWLVAAHPQDGAAVACQVARAMRERRPFRHGLRIACLDGRTRHVLLTGLPAPHGYTGALVDVTEQHETLDAATGSAAGQRLIVENTSDLIAHCGPDGRYVHVSPSYTRLLGWKAEELVGRSVVEFLHPDDRDNARQGLMMVMNGINLNRVMEVRKRDAHGAYITLGTKASAVTDPVTGANLGAVLVSRDVSLELAMRQQLHDMAEEKVALVESIDDGFFSVNANWEITYANTQAAAFVGISREEAIGEVVWDITPGLAESEVGAHLREAMARRESISFESFYAPLGIWVAERIYAYKDGLSVFFHDITERKLAEAQLEQLATHDSLTGLPNRAWINRRVDTMLAQPAGASHTTVFFIDLNRFKEVNDSLGHAAGDVLLRQVAARLQSCMRPGDVVARQGGDEFVVAASCTGREAASAIAQRLLQALDAPFVADGLEMRVGASIGISLSDAGVASQLLFQKADTAMYKAKALGGAGYQFFEPEMCTGAKRRLQLEAGLHRALEQRQFELVFQPRVDLGTLRVRGIEALLRWNHPELGRISPLEFIPLAEERGHIEAIGRWVLHEACRTASQLNARHGLALTVSVNVSARQLRSSALVDEVLAALAGSGLSPRLLELEITESALIEDMAQSEQILHRLKAAGVRLALDDFGTGYSSLSYLKRFPVDVLKLDRSFIGQDGADLQFVGALIAMAHALGLSVVAEGIETPAVMRSLQRGACDEGQGYLFARPLPLGDLEGYLAGAAAVMELAAA